MNNTAQNYLAFCEDIETAKKKPLSFGVLMTGIFLMQATGTHDVVKALGNHTIEGLQSYLRKNLAEKTPEAVRALITAYLATDPEAEKKAQEEEKARKEAEKAMRRAEKKARKEAEKAMRRAEKEAKKQAKRDRREAELLAFFGTAANGIN